MEKNDWPAGKRYAFLALTVTFLLALFDFVDRQVLASLFPFIKKEWGLSDTQLGGLVAIVNISIAVLAIPSAIFIDRWSRKKMLALMGVVWSVATGACAFAGTYAHLFIARFFIGAGEAGYMPAANSLLSALFPKRLRARVLSLIVVGTSLGVPLGLMTGAWIATHWGWRQAFGVVAVPGFFIALLALRLKDYKNVELSAAGPEQSAGNAGRPALLVILGAMLKTPTLLLVYLGTTSMLFFNGIVMNWLPTYFNRMAGIPMVEAAAYTSMALITSILSLLFFGTPADWLRKRLHNATTLMATACLSVSSFLFLLAFGALDPGSSLQIACLMVAHFTVACVSPLAYTTIIDLVHPGVRATGISLLITLQNVCGMGLGPLVAGAVSDRYDLGTAITMLAFAVVLGAVLYLLACLTYGRDLRKVSTSVAEIKF
jgi:MFS family permease